MTTAELPAAAADPKKDGTRSALTIAVQPGHPIQNRTASIGLLAGALVTAVMGILSGAGIVAPDPSLTASLTTLATFALSWAIPCDGTRWTALEH